MIRLSTDATSTDATSTEATSTGATSTEATKDQLRTQCIVFLKPTLSTNNSNNMVFFFIN